MQNSADTDISTFISMMDYFLNYKYNSRHIFDKLDVSNFSEYQGQFKQCMDFVAYHNGLGISKDFGND